MKTLKVVLVIFVSLMIIGDTLATPFLERIYNANTNNGYRIIRTTKRSRARTEKPRGRSFKDICRAINPAPYAYPNKIPYPSVPIC